MKNNAFAPLPVDSEVCGELANIYIAMAADLLHPGHIISQKSHETSPQS